MKTLLFTLLILIICSSLAYADHSDQALAELKQAYEQTSNEIGGGGSMGQTKANVMNTKGNVRLNMARATAAAKVYEESVGMNYVDACQKYGKDRADADIETYHKMLPTMNDTKESYNMKVKGVKELAKLNRQYYQNRE